MADYTIERGVGVRERMNLLARAHAPGTTSLLDMIGIEAGARCVDLGCGGGHVTLELARRAGPSGAVLGVDLDEELLQLARAEATAQQIENITFRFGSVEEFCDGELDLAFARMLLSHLRDPSALVARMVGAVRPGGVVVVEDVHFNGCFTEPACRGYDRWVDWFKEAVRRSGGDLDIGPRLPAMLRAAHLGDVGVRVVQPAQIDGPVKQLQQLTMAKVRSAVLAAGIVTPAEYDEAHADLKAFTDAEGTLVASPRMIQAWGRRV
jgi:SAM-dependent methyltransferase